MMGVVDPVAARLAVPLALPIGIGLSPAHAAQGVGFAEMLQAGIQAVDHKISNSDVLVRNFTLDGSVPIHQVTAALEEARMAVEVAMQVRARLVETYRDFMAMQI